MTNPTPKNLAASVHQRLVNFAHHERKDVNLVLTRFALERFLYRLSRSSHADRFILKGAMLFLVWRGNDARPTRDVDLLARIEPDADLVRETLQAICRTVVDADGLEFRAELLALEPIQALRAFGGYRATIPVLLGRIRLQVQVDLGFGDAVTPAPAQVDYPVLLDFPAPRLMTYHMETVIAEKLHAMLTLGTLNTRTKDYFDLLVLARSFSFRGSDLASAIFATLSARGTAVPPNTPDGLSDAFGNDPVVATRWNAFVRRNDLTERTTWPEVIRFLREFLLPPLRAAGSEYPLVWENGGPWR